MNQNYQNIRADNPNYNQSQSTYPPYMNIPGYTNNANQANTVNNPQYAENIFALNLGKKVDVYFSYPDSVEWRDKVFSGTILEAGRDYLLLKNEENKIILLWLIYINYAIFEDEISY